MMDNGPRAGEGNGSTRTKGQGAGPAQSRLPQTSLPKGGGAIRGIGEKFAANPVTGTGSLSIPIVTSPGRSGFGPQLSLSYDSGAGNGPFGLGWNLSLPSITRKTDKGLPRYKDAIESDEFILSGAEDLVPILVENEEDHWEQEIVPPRMVDGETYDIRRYLPRSEGLFARIERWTNQSDRTDSFWRSISKNNITTWYGKTSESRIADPANPDHIFSWLICESYDDKGNVIAYGYEAEDSTDINLFQAHQAQERNRSDNNRSSNRYIKQIRYGNRQPYFPSLTADQPVTPLPSGWLFKVVFDYGEHDIDSPSPNDNGAWIPRHDPFSTYRPGFEVRTYRLCQRVLMFHHFRDEAEVGANCLVRSTDFNYHYEQDSASADPRNPIHTVLTSVTQCGYRKQTNDGYLKKTMPPVEFDYSQAVVGKEIKEVESDSLENLPYGVDGANYQWVDLDGEGVSGVLTEQGGGLFYKYNESPITRSVENGTARYDVRLGPVQPVASIPSGGLSGVSNRQFLDLAGDGQVDLVELDRPTAGFYERTHDQGWQTFRAFQNVPNIDWNDPNLKFIDLTGDGHADVLITEHEALTWYASLAETGFDAAERMTIPTDEKQGPRVVFADGAQTLFQADLSGDGLTDIVRIRNGEVCYWPNLGYGRFGAKVTMDDAPWFDSPDQFNPRRIRLADIDGSGVTDIIYLGRNKTQFWFNQSGNAWSNPQTLEAFPPVDNIASVAAVDLLGNGTACLVWSTPLPGESLAPMRFVELMAAGKPHLMTATRNNLGAETQVRYAPFAYFYFKDKQAGKPWIMRLPFPVHVVERVETYDHISRNRFVTRYAYHHGYFDGEEREFRGFGMVEQWDTEEYAALAGNGPRPNIPGAEETFVATNLDETSHVPPVLTKTWFHTGIYLGRHRVSNFFAGLRDSHDRGEYYREPEWLDDDDEAKKHILDDTILPADLTIEEEREACRALKGAMLRQEVYALDGSGTEDYPHGHPYTVTEQNLSIQRVQPQAGNRHAVFFTHAREAINYHYERNHADPRISHSLTLEVDPYGNVLKALAIGYGRRPGQSPLEGEDQKKQEQRLVTYTENAFTKSIDLPIDDQDYDPDNYRAPLPAETRTYEMTGIEPENDAARFSFDEWMRNGFALLASLEVIDYENTAVTGTEQKRLIEHVRTLYRKDDLTALLTLGEVEPLALPGESYTLAFTPGLLAEVFQRDGQPLLSNPAIVLGGHGADQGGYVVSQDLKAAGVFPNTDADNYWWIPSGWVFLDPGADAANPANTAAQEIEAARRHFFLPRMVTDPFGHSSLVDYDGPSDPDKPRYDLLVVHTRDALDNTVTATNDYRVLQPRLVTDANGNRTEVAFDTLGMVVGTAVMGKEDEPDGSPKGDSLDGFEAEVKLEELNKVMTKPREPGVVPSEGAATQIAHDLLGKATTRIVYDLERFQRSGKPPFAATIARERHVSDLAQGDRSRLQISFSYSDGFGCEIQKKIQAEPEPVVEGGPIVNPRWIGSGWTIFNNKGKPVRQYEPFFDDTHDFKFGREVGVSPILFYDPLGRVVATLHPNHTYEKVVFDPWRQTTYDVNDTVTLDPRIDEDVRGFFLHPDNTSRLPPADYLPTWHALRTDPAHAEEANDQWPDPEVRDAETNAAEKAAVHAETPTIVHFDSLGRTFLTVVDNGKDTAGVD